MIDNNLEKKLVKAYSQVFYDFLMEKIESEDGVRDFDNLSEENKEKIGYQAGKKAIILAKGFVKEMRELGYLEKKPSESQLDVLFKKYMEENARNSTF